MRRKPKQAPPTDPRWKNWLERIDADLEFFETILAMENSQDAVKIERHRSAVKVLTQRREHYLTLSGIEQHLGLREINGELLEHWRALRALARVGGHYRLNYGLLGAPTGAESSRAT